MDFVVSHLTMDCSLGNPTVPAAFAFSALLLGAWMARLFGSRRSPRRKAVFLLLVLVLSVPLSQILQGTAITLRVLWHVPEGDPVPAVSCMDRPHALASPTATMLAGWMIYAGWLLWRRPLSMHALGTLMVAAAALSAAITWQSLPMHVRYASEMRDAELLLDRVWKFKREHGRVPTPAELEWPDYPLLYQTDDSASGFWMGLGVGWARMLLEPNSGEWQPVQRMREEER